MKKPVNAHSREYLKEPRAITELAVSGYKSVSQEQRIEIRPLTILAGVNSSGKSSMMQPLLLLKQTLEAPYDPGPLLINGPNVKFTSVDQLLSRTGKSQSTDILHAEIKTSWQATVGLTFRKKHGHGFELDQMRSKGGLGDFTLWPAMTPQEVQSLKIASARNWEEEFALLPPERRTKMRWSIMPERCFLEPALVAEAADGTSYFTSQPLTESVETLIAGVIHVPGLRGNPERAYPATAVGPRYPGTFERYPASVIAEWAKEKDQKKLDELNEDLTKLGLTGGVWPHAPNDAQIELHVSRLPSVAPRKPEDRVSIADVGFGVSQTLPVLVALRAAKPGQLVYIEQPETHLHPRAQTALAEILASAAERGVRVVAETHSALLLLAIQTLVAEGKLSPAKVKLHWFERKKDGHTVVRSADLDESGAFGEWPEDFGEVTLRAQSRYLDAAESR